MGVLILGDDDVRGLLDMESCIAAMEDILARLARDELLNPLRFIMATPSRRGIGLMPAWRGGDDPVFSLKEIVVAPSNSAIGLDPHQGAVLLHDGTTGKLRAILNASAVTEIRTAAVSAVATKLLARGAPRQVAILGAGVQARSHVEAMRTIAPGCEIRLWSRTPANAEALALEAHAHVASSAREAVDGADVVCTCTSAKEPILELEWLSPGQHLNVVGSSVAHAREVDSATMAASSLFVDRRESTLNEGGDYLFPAAEGLIGPDHIRAELGEILTGAHPGRTGAEEITLFKSLGIAVEDLASAELCFARARERGVGVEVEF
jgi:ornithine cyclodeaminase/alanine dehydrogenase-like protein (mu-crystallin family)